MPTYLHIYTRVKKISFSSIIEKKLIEIVSGNIRTKNLSRPKQR